MKEKDDAKRSLLAKLIVESDVARAALLNKNNSIRFNALTAFTLAFLTGALGSFYREARYAGAFLFGWFIYWCWQTTFYDAVFNTALRMELGNRVDKPSRDGAEQQEPPLG